MVSRVPLLTPDLPSLDSLLPRYEYLFQAQRATNFGALVGELEARLSDMLGAYVVTTANGTLALELALTALNLPKDSPVLCPALSFPASATAICRAGHRPVFVDVDPETWCIATNRFSLWRGEGKSTMAVSAFGAALEDAGALRGLPLVVDAAAAFGNQAPIVGALTCYSLHATKALIAGEGGAIATHDAGMAKRLRALTNFGIGTGVVGTNAKMSEYHAAVGLASLDTWEERSALRRSAAILYREILPAALKWQHWRESWTKTIFPVLLPPHIDIDAVAQALAADGVETRRWYYPLLNETEMFHHAPTLADGTARDISARLLGLPFFTGITEQQMRKVSDAMRHALLTCGPRHP